MAEKCVEVSPFFLFILLDDCVIVFFLLVERATQTTMRKKRDVETIKCCFIFSLWPIGAAGEIWWVKAARGHFSKSCSLRKAELTNWPIKIMVNKTSSPSTDIGVDLLLVGARLRLTVSCHQSVKLWGRGVWLQVSLFLSPISVVEFYIEGANLPACNSFPFSPRNLGHQTTYRQKTETRNQRDMNTIARFAKSQGLKMYFLTFFLYFSSSFFFHHHRRFVAYICVSQPMLQHRALHKVLQ